MTKPVYYIYLILCSLLLVCGCRTVASKYVINDSGTLIEVERMELRGVGKNEAQFTDKSKIKNDSGFKMPTIEIDELDVNK